MNNKHMIPALDKAVGVLEYLGKTENGATQAELCKALDITTSTCYRILQTLLARNWVRQNPGNLYDVSSGILFATIKLMDTVRQFECLQPILDSLAASTGLSCKLSIRQGESQVTILRAESPAPMAVSGKVGARFPLVEGSTGTALLADESDKNIQTMLAKVALDIVEKDHPKIVSKRLEHLKKLGYCMNIRPNRWKVETMAAPIRNEEGFVIAAITILGFADDFTDGSIKEKARHLRDSIAESKQIL